MTRSVGWCTRYPHPISTRVAEQRPPSGEQLRWTQASPGLQPREPRSPEQVAPWVEKIQLNAESGRGSRAVIGALRASTAVIGQPGNLVCDWTAEAEDPPGLLGLDEGHKVLSMLDFPAFFSIDDFCLYRQRYSDGKLCPQSLKVLLCVCSHNHTHPYDVNFVRRRDNAVLGGCDLQLRRRDRGILPVCFQLRVQ
ncbi:hypothetical protein P7K49_008982 [Saguinus oedipus]|uniref:Uncharacterized protein n=1 Tax=Saguinus oedipus TaxID=9490 RepID=A0ABQ9VZA2_SAGOE|nr:hypothetical protein P7K49_008982 [Saguinus oedipus]